MLLSSLVVSDSLQLHGLQHARLPCPSPTPRVCSNSCPSSQWCHPTISSSVIPFFPWLQSFPVSGSFLMSQLFVLGGQNTGISASASVLPMNIQGWFPLELTAVVRGTHRSLLQHDSLKAFNTMFFTFLCFVTVILLCQIDPSMVHCCIVLLGTTSWHGLHKENIWAFL